MVERPSWMHEDEAKMAAAGLGYSDEQRRAALDSILLDARLLQGVEPWRLSPYTDGLFEIERAFSYLVSRVEEGPGGRAAIEAVEDSLPDSR